MTGPTERCENTDLLVDQCAHCRGNDQTVEEQADAEQLRLRGRLLSSPMREGWFPAQYPGRCWACGAGFGPGIAIRRTRAEELLAETEPGYVAECCAVTS